MAEFINATIMMGVVDETDSLRETVCSLLKICHHDDIKEIILGCSEHMTKDAECVVKELAAMQSDVPIIWFVQKKRKLAVLTEIIEKAQGSHCILVSSDGAMDLECVPMMIEEAKKDGNRIVKISRWLKGCRFFEYNKIQYVFNLLAQKYLKVLFGGNITDYTNPGSIVPTELLKSIKWENDEFPLLMEYVLKPLRLGYRYLEIPSNCYPRKQGKSSNSFTQKAKYFGASLHIRFQKKESMLQKNSVLYDKFIGKNERG